MKNKVFVLFLIGFYTLNAQVGVNTMEPTSTLDVNGELRIRNLEYQDIEESGINFLTADSIGNTGRDQSDVDFVNLNFSKANTFNLRYISEGQPPHIFDLGIEVTAKIPANKLITLLVSYSLPIGYFDNKANDDIQNIQGSKYLGVELVRVENGTEKILPEGSRKFTPSTSVTRAWNMISISNQYVETFEPATMERTVTFKLKGYGQYVDKLQSGIKKMNGVRYLMYDVDDKPNYNWGRAYMTYETLEINAR